MQLLTKDQGLAPLSLIRQHIKDPSGSLSPGSRRHACVWQPQQRGMFAQCCDPKADSRRSSGLMSDDEHSEPWDRKHRALTTPSCGRPEAREVEGHPGPRASFTNAETEAQAGRELIPRTPEGQMGGHWQV